MLTKRGKMEMKPTVNNNWTAKLAAELVTEPQFPQHPVNSRRVIQWVDHFFGCSTCRKPNTSFPVEAKTRSELCESGRQLLDLWLDEE